MSLENEKRKELEEKILSKRQQIEFERNSVEADQMLSDDNRENPDVKEEMINAGQSPESDLDATDLKSLKSLEQDLEDLIQELDDLKRG
ncbi:hypothetical protein [Dyadobacter sp. CY323]|uniref:hypothetical protein n=1 Tax=Dyadobacter sp. CY323 TaxID=2907302 RepID=UPI001F1F5F39|nr:hypothetical protein [Dyadobacter sp. CY323]MCE6990020.1 hypothetical protein [Dyadobacter sp. CY323]